MNNLIKKIILCLCMFSTTGCISHYGGDFESPSAGDSKLVNNKYFIFPALMGSSGTTTPLTKDLSITTIRVANQTSADDFVDNDKCNLSIINQDNSDKKIPKLGALPISESLNSYGYDYFTGMLKKSTGKVKGSAFIKKYTNDELNCYVVLSDIASDDGTEGGPVYDRDGRLVGIIVQGTEVFYNYTKEQTQAQEVLNNKSSTYVVNGKEVSIKDPAKAEIYDFSYDKNKPIKVSYTAIIPIDNIINWLKLVAEKKNETLDIDNNLISRSR